MAIIVTHPFPYIVISSASELDSSIATSSSVVTIEPCKATAHVRRRHMREFQNKQHTIRKFRRVKPSQKTDSATCCTHTAPCGHHAPAFPVSRLSLPYSSQSSSQSANTTRLGCPMKRLVTTALRYNGRRRFSGPAKFLKRVENERRSH